MTRNDVRRIGRAFQRDDHGTAAVLLAVSLVPIIGLVGAAVDYSRATRFRAKLHTAADAAALAAAKQPNAPLDKRQAVGRQVFDTVLGPAPGIEKVWFKLTEVPSGVRVDAGGEVINRIVSIAGFKSTAVDTMAQAVSVAAPTEVALVLDNTGSMRNDMAALRQAATQFAETLFGKASGDQLKMAVVPYVAAVNPGRANLASAWMDVQAQSRWHGHHLENRVIGDMVNCDASPFPKPQQAGGGGGGGGGSNGSGSGGAKPTDVLPKGKDRAGLDGPLSTVADLALELFGVKAARAEVTPRTDTPGTGTDVTPGSPYRTDGGTSKLPSGFVWDQPCRLRNPARISHFDLFNRIQGAAWKGCVEARPEPYDVTDDLPSSANPDTLFVPYFWPDEPGKYDSTAYANSYLDDGPSPPGWTLGGQARQFANLFKYHVASRTRIVGLPPASVGPNAACPDEVLPLNHQKSTVINKIASLRHWDGGGTINSEGVMWGWRVLSPSAPFTEGAEYGKAKKFLVLMSDGMNSFVANNPNGPTKSDYTAYGYLRNGRLPSDWFSKGEEYLDQRMRLACENAKKAGIRILTILFREVDTRTIELMRECASDPKNAYLAASDVELRRAFDEVAGAITSLRLTK